MEIFKIENFEKSYPDKAFPIFKTLTTHEAAHQFSKLSANFFEEDKVIKPSDLLHLIKEKENSTNNYCAMNEGFDLALFVCSLAIKPNDTVYLNWHHFDNIDEIKLSDLCGHFDDIWYSGADDLDIFDDSFEWILSVSHGGNISLLA